MQTATTTPAETKERPSLTLGSPAPLTRKARSSENEPVLASSSLPRLPQTPKSATKLMPITTGIVTASPKSRSIIQKQKITEGVRQRIRSRVHADKLRLRLRAAYYKVATHQEKLPLAEITNTVNSKTTSAK